jgi:hypothetical protein
VGNSGLLRRAPQARAARRGHPAPHIRDAIGISGLTRGGIAEHRAGSSAMRHPPPITTKPGRKSGELIVQLPPGWNLRLRRVLRTLRVDALPPAPAATSAGQKDARVRARRRQAQAAIARFVSEVLTAEIVGKEIALATRNRFGTRRGSLREHVQAILRDVAGA